jgi:DMSO/TMAO reductase YedYZ molybdopterin-dependent catalytic subunit
MATRGFFGRRPPPEDAARLPPGQYREDGFPVLSAGPTPQVATPSWRFTLKNGPKPIAAWSWEEFGKLPRTRVHTDIHCVTKWSKFDTTWTGVRVRDLLDQAGVQPAATHVVEHAEFGYTTNLPLADIVTDEAIVAYAFDGAEIEPIHGGPVRIVVPHLYFWKSAKWVRALELRDTDQPGFWERNGYHMYGDPFREQRHWGD